MRAIGRLWVRPSIAPAIGRQCLLGLQKSQWRHSSSLQANNENPAGKKMYILPMFPYPSGDLHLGHLRVYTISDVLSRFRRMQGYDVRHRIGWDAFGLPAENAAIERGIAPAVWTKRNIERMKTQLQAMNGHWDWDSELATCDPSFYKHTQKIFLMLHEAGLAYQAESLVNYDPVDKTVLANEQVDANGYSWRSGAKVEKRNLRQWFLKISEYRQELLDDISVLEKDGAWPERILTQQRNWLGKSTGARIKFPVIAFDYQTHSEIEVFTTRPDTIFGVQYLALASTHPIVKSLAKNDVELQSFLDTIPALPPDSKLGYLLPHVGALNPMAYEDWTPDAVKATLPIYVAPYVLGDYGDGAVMGVPGHDSRDHAFWKHNRDADPIRLVISESPDGSTTAMSNAPYTQHGHLTHHAGPYEGWKTADATKEIIKLLEKKGLGKLAESWRLRDWLISRQRYWGTPIPIIHCKSCGPVPVPDDQLPVELPPVDSHWGGGRTGNPLDHAHEWVNVPCPKCGEGAKRDTDTMDTFVDSSWYFMRFPDSHNTAEPFSKQAANASLPVDIYIGGVEHAILHLLYARFISKFMAKSGAWPEGAKYYGEPFKKVIAQGMVHGKTYSDPDSGRFLKPDEVNLADSSKPIVIATGKQATITFEKMSKSKYNGVDPGACIEKYGADAIRAHILFQAPVSEVMVWDEDKITGITRWLKRIEEFIISNPSIWKVGQTNLESLAATDSNPTIAYWKQLDSDSKNISPEDLASAKKMWKLVEDTISSVTESYSSTYSLNTVVSDLMLLSNSLVTYTNSPSLLPIFDFLPLHAIETLLKMLFPICPDFAERNWHIIHFEDPSPISSQSFPVLTKGLGKYLKPNTQSCAVQINGKLKFAVEIPLLPREEEMGDGGVEEWVVEKILGTREGRERVEELGRRGTDVRGAKRVIVVKGGRTVNFVM